jgi:hypothetical protein
MQNTNRKEDSPCDQKSPQSFSKARKDVVKPCKKAGKPNSCCDPSTHFISPLFNVIFFLFRFLGAFSVPLTALCYRITLFHDEDGAR